MQRLSNDKLLTTKEAARFAGMKESTLERYRLKSFHEGPKWVRVGKKVYYTPRALNDYKMTHYRPSYVEEWMIHIEDYYFDLDEKGNLKWP